MKLRLCSKVRRYYQSQINDIKSWHHDIILTGVSEMVDGDDNDAWPLGKILIVIKTLENDISWKNISMSMLSIPDL